RTMAPSPAAPTNVTVPESSDAASSLGTRQRIGALTAARPAPLPGDPAEGRAASGRPAVAPLAGIGRASHVVRLHRQRCDRISEEPGAGDGHVDAVRAGATDQGVLPGGPEATE